MIVLFRDRSHVQISDDEGRIQERGHPFLGYRTVWVGPKRIVLVRNVISGKILHEWDSNRRISFEGSTATIDPDHNWDVSGWLVVISPSGSIEDILGEIVWVGEATAFASVDVDKVVSSYEAATSVPVNIPVKVGPVPVSTPVQNVAQASAQASVSDQDTDTVSEEEEDEGSPWTVPIEGSHYGELIARRRREAEFEASKLKDLPDWVWEV